MYRTPALYRHTCVFQLDSSCTLDLPCLFHGVYLRPSFAGERRRYSYSSGQEHHLREFATRPALVKAANMETPSPAKQRESVAGVRSYDSTLLLKVLVFAQVLNSDRIPRKCTPESDPSLAKCGVCGPQLSPRLKPDHLWTICLKQL